MKVPEPYAQDEYLTWPSTTASGAIWSQVEGFDLEGELSRSDTGEAQLKVTERLQVGFAPGSGSVPQFEREWPFTRFGQDLGLEVHDVRIDGASVPFDVTHGIRTAKATTRLSEVLNGTYDVEIQYTLDAPAVEVGDGGDAVQQVRWGALLWFWEDTFYVDQTDPFGEKERLRQMRVQLTVAEELAGEVRSGGWIGFGNDDVKSQPYENGSGFDPWDKTRSAYVYDESKEFGEPGHSTLYELRLGQVIERADGAAVFVFDVTEAETRAVDDSGLAQEQRGEFTVDPDLNRNFSKYELGLNNDLGAVLNFADGTFTNVTPGSYEKYRINHGAPIGVLVGFTVLVLIGAAAVFVARIRNGAHTGLSAVLTSAGTITVLAAAQSVMFWWVVGGMAGSNSVGGALIALGLLMWGVVVAQWIAVARARLSSRAATVSA